MKSAEDNAERIVVKSPMPGVVVMRMGWRGNGQVEIQEGEEARPGMPIMQVVDPALMQVRVKVNQGDVHVLRAGQPARVSLDAYPDLHFTGRVEQVTPVGTTSMLTNRVRNFVAIVSIQGPSELMPTFGRQSTSTRRQGQCLVVPRDAVVKRTTRQRAGARGGSTARERSGGCHERLRVVVASGLTGATGEMWQVTAELLFSCGDLDPVDCGCERRGRQRRGRCGRLLSSQGGVLDICRCEENEAVRYVTLT